MSNDPVPVAKGGEVRRCRADGTREWAKMPGVAGDYEAVVGERDAQWATNNRNADVYRDNMAALIAERDELAGELAKARGERDALTERVRQLEVLAHDFARDLDSGSTKLLALELRNRLRKLKEEAAP